MEPEQVLFAIVFVLAMFGGIFIVYLGLRQRTHQLEMQHRERMAMIERGQIPLVDPSPLHVRRVAAVGSSRSLSVGIITIGLGLAMMTIIGVAADAPSVGIGIGGAITILGIAFIVRSVLVRSNAPAPAEAATQPAAQEPRRDL
jgi:hypothetical protein